MRVLVLTTCLLAVGHMKHSRTCGGGGLVLPVVVPGNGRAAGHYALRDVATRAGTTCTSPYIVTYGTDVLLLNTYMMVCVPSPRYV